MRVVKRIAAIVVALVGLASVGALVWADGAWSPAPAVAGSPAVIEVAPGDSEVVCAASLKLPGDGEDQVVYDPRFDPNATSVDSITRGLVASASGGRAQGLDEASAPARLSGRGTDVAVTNERVGEAPVQLVASAAGEGEAAPAAAGATFQHLADGDLRGVAAAACIPASSDAWIVAGSTETGSSSRLLLTNAGFTNVRADLKLWDGAGEVEAVGLTGLAVPARSQRAVLLEGFIGESSRLVVQVTATGGDLAVFLQHSRLEGLTQGGVELAVPGLAPAQEVTVPGLNVTASTFDSARTSALRVLVPGDLAAVVNVELWGPDGPTSLPGLEDAIMNPRVVTDLSLGGLAEGRYTAVIRSDQPVVASGLSLRTSGEGQPEELAWTPSAASSTEGYVALPTSDLDAYLVVGSGVATSLELTPIDQRGQAGASTKVEVPAGTTRALDLEAMGADGETAALRFRWDGPVGALALNVSADDPDGELISAVVPASLSLSSAEVRVYPAAP
ncbi:MAG: DUF5719 family protein [Bifidobacteriaceae bacterium]|jgi:hypothetical protein|nr:DUF5719 family protein [Bifidobacteriaceae bacterium]